MKQDVADLIQGIIQEYVDKWKFLMDGIGMTVTHAYMPTVNIDDRDAMANTFAFWEYSTATIKWWLGHVATCARADIESAVVHEYVHCLLNSMERQVPEAKRNNECCEYAVENVTKALLAQDAAGVEQP